MKKIFLTGGAGFIGSHLADNLLKKGHFVTVFDNLQTGKLEFLNTIIENKNFKFIKGDITSFSSINKALTNDYDTVFHLAANPDIAKGFTNPSIDLHQTIVGTFNILQEMRTKKIRRLIYFSGSGVYGNVGNIKTNETFGPLLPVSMYGAAKLSAEGLISAFSHLYGIQSWIFRPANIIGNRATHGVILDLINKLKKNPTTLEILGNGKQSKSYVYIKDVISAIQIAIEKTNDQVNIINICNNSYITVNEIASMIIDEMKLKKVKIHRSEDQFGWPGDVPIVRLDNSKLKGLGWKENYSSKEAVRQTIKDLL